VLESQQLLIIARPASRGAGGVYDIFDYGTNERVGSARVAPTPRTGLLRWLAGNKLVAGAIEVRETEDEPLLFTLRGRRALWRQRTEVYDADGQLVGYIKRSLRPQTLALSVFDHSGRLFANLYGSAVSLTGVFITPDVLDLGDMAKIDGSLPGNWHALSARSVLLTIRDMLADEPIGKMLLLAAALMSCAETKLSSTETQSC
jgi:hypothetical protein